MNRWTATVLLLLTCSAGGLWFLRGRDDTLSTSSRDGMPGHEATPSPPQDGAVSEVAPERTAADSEAAPPFELRGSVVELGGSPPRPRPAAGVEVLVEGIGARAQLVTDRDGSFRGTLMDGGHRPVELTAVVAGDDTFRPCMDSVLLRSAADSLSGFHLVRAPHGELRGVTVDPAGAALANVEVKFQQAACRSAAAGHFAVPASCGDLLGADRTGCRLLAPRGPRPAPAGGYEPLRLTLTRLGRLRVTVVDAAGAAVAEAAVTVRLSPKEDLARDLRPQAEVPFGRTDAAGCVELPAVWAAVFLEVTVQSPRGSFSYRSQHDGALELSGERGIQAAADAVLDLTAQLPRQVALKGRILSAEGEPAPFPWIRLSPGSGEGAWVDAFTADAQGAFERWIPAADQDRLVSVRAADRSPGSIPFAEGLACEVRVPAVPAEPPFLELELATLRGLHGQVVAAGKSCPALCRAVPSGTPWCSAVLESQEVRTGDGGEFHLVGLLDGVYDLLVLPDRVPGDIALGVHRFSGIAAGTWDAVLEIPEEPCTRVSVTLEAPRGLRGSGLQILRALEPWEGAARVPGAHERFDAPAGVPALPLPPVTPWRSPAAEILSDGDRWYVSTVRTAYGGVDPVRHSLALAPGDYWIVAFGEDSWGSPYAPASTGALRLGPGDHELEICLLPQLPLTGRWSAAPPDQWIGLVDAAGKALPCYDPSQGFRRCQPLGAQGEFRLAAVPVGLVGLAAGTQEQWRSGTPRLLRWLEASRETPRVDLQ